MQIKNWKKFQHFKDRKPPWVKLYRDVLDDLEWYELDPLASKVLVMCWLIASEDDGKLPPAKTLAFRLRMSEKQTNDCLNKLSHWLEQDDISVISERYQNKEQKAHAFLLIGFYQKNGQIGQDRKDLIWICGVWVSSFETTGVQKLVQAQQNWIGKPHGGIGFEIRNSLTSLWTLQG